MSEVLPGVRGWKECKEKGVLVSKAVLADAYNEWRQAHDLKALDEITTGRILRKVIPKMRDGKVAVGGGMKRVNAYRVCSLQDCIAQFEKAHSVSVDPEEARVDEANEDCLEFPMRWLEERRTAEGATETVWCEDPFEAAGFDLKYRAVIDMLWERTDNGARLGRHLDRLNTGAVATHPERVLASTGDYSYSVNEERPIPG